MVVSRVYFILTKPYETNPSRETTPKENQPQLEETEDETGPGVYHWQDEVKVVNYGETIF